MDDGFWRERRSGDDRRHPRDRRQRPERRAGEDRRGSGLVTPRSSEPRPYGFRAFVDRRSGQDRRDGGDGGGDRRGQAERREGVITGDATVELTAEEIAALIGDEQR
jgi:hypothetical protein